MANNSKITLRIRDRRRSYAYGRDKQGSYIDYFLLDVIQDIIDQDKIKEFAKLWDQMVVHPNQRVLI